MQAKRLNCFVPAAGTGTVGNCFVPAVGAGTIGVNKRDNSLKQLTQIQTYPKARHIIKPCSNKQSRAIGGVPAAGTGTVGNCFVPAVGKGTIGVNKRDNSLKQQTHIQTYPKARHIIKPCSNQQSRAIGGYTAVSGIWHALHTSYPQVLQRAPQVP
jgi:hypothetical protein